jgi:hypothetical protein
MSPSGPWVTHRSTSLRAPSQSAIEMNVRGRRADGGGGDAAPDPKTAVKAPLSRVAPTDARRRDAP